MYAFVVCNLLMATVAGSAWQLGLITNLGSLPKSEYIMIGFLTLQWAIGLVFVLQKKWEALYFTANTLPMWALVCLGLNIYNVLAAANSISPEIAFGILKGAGLAILINSFGVFLMIWLKKLAFFCGASHV